MTLLLMPAPHEILILMRVLSSQPHSSVSRLRLAHTAFNNNVGFTDSVPLSSGLVGPGFHPGRLKMAIVPAFLHPPRNYINRRLSSTKLPKNPSSLTLEAPKNTKCLNPTSTAISTVLIMTIPLAMCGITARLLTRSPKFWHGYHHSNPRYGTTTSKAAGSTTSETGSYRLRNIGISLVVLVAAILLVRPCFVTEARGLAKHLLGKREDS